MVLNSDSWTVTKEWKLGNLEKNIQTIILRNLLNINIENLTKSQAY